VKHIFHSITIRHWDTEFCRRYVLYRILFWCW